MMQERLISKDRISYALERERKKRKKNLGDYVSEAEVVSIHTYTYIHSI